MYRFNFAPPSTTRRSARPPCTPSARKTMKRAGGQSQVLADLRIVVGLRHADELIPARTSWCRRTSKGQGAAEGSGLRQHAHPGRARDRRGHAVGPTGGDGPSRAPASTSTWSRWTGRAYATRRASKAAPAEGGWNIHNTNWYANDVMESAQPMPAAANGDNAWFGWGLTCRRWKNCAPSSP